MKDSIKFGTPIKLLNKGPQAIFQRPLYNSSALTQPILKIFLPASTI